MKSRKNRPEKTLLFAAAILTGLFQMIVYRMKVARIDPAAPVAELQKKVKAAERYKLIRDRTAYFSGLPAIAGMLLVVGFRVSTAESYVMLALIVLVFAGSSWYKFNATKERFRQLNDQLRMWSDLEK